MEPLFVDCGYSLRLACDIFRTYNQANHIGESLDFVGLTREDTALDEPDAMTMKFLRQALDLDSSRRNRHPKDAEKYIRLAVHKARALFDSWNPSGVVLWNGQSFWHQVLVAEAKRRSIPVCFLENGYFPGTLCIDRTGINFGSESLRRDPSPTYDHERIHQLLSTVRQQQIDRTAPPRRAAERDVETLVNKRRWRHYASSLSPFLSEDQRLHTDPLPHKVRKLLHGDKYLNQTLAAETRPLPIERTIFLPLQVANDTQITLYSDWIHSMEQLVDVVLRNVPKGYTVIVRDHPEDRKNRSYEGIIRSVLDAGGAWAPSHDLLSIIRNCSLIVTINSTVGFEGLIWDKPVITLGQAFYAGPGGATHVSQESDLRSTMMNALTEPIDIEARESLLASIAFTAHFRGGLGFLEANDQKESVECILKTLK